MNETNAQEFSIPSAKPNSTDTFTATPIDLITLKATHILELPTYNFTDASPQLLPLYATDLNSSTLGSVPITNQLILTQLTP